VIAKLAYDIRIPGLGWVGRCNLVVGLPVYDGYRDLISEGRVGRIYYHAAAGNVAGMKG